MSKLIKYIALTRTAYGSQKYPTYILTVPMKVVKDMGLENERTIHLEYDDEEKVIKLKKIKEQ